MTKSQLNQIFPDELYEVLTNFDPQKNLPERVKRLNDFLREIVRDTRLLDAVKEYGQPLDFAQFEPYQNKETAEYQRLRLDGEGLLVVRRGEIEIVNRVLQEVSGRVYFLRKDANESDPTPIKDVSLAEFMNEDHIITANQVYNSLEKEIMNVINRTLL